jgi:uncharacterized protein YaeQ
LAQTATVYTETIDLADMDRHVYETDLGDQSWTLPLVEASPQFVNGS